MKDEPIPHKNFTFLGQGSYEITGGGGGGGVPPLGIRCGSKTLGIRRVNRAAELFSANHRFLVYFGPNFFLQLCL